MSHFSVNSILPANVYNSLVIDHEATRLADLLELRRKHLPALFAILAAHSVADFVELHLLHRHFTLQDGEAVVHRTLEISGSEDIASISVDIAKVVGCPQSIKSSLVPLMWMASSDGSLVAYEYGLRKFAKSSEALAINISPGTWNSFAQEFSAYVRSAGIAEIVSLKDKGCINGGEYVVPSMRVLFRVPMEVVNLQPGSAMLESGWGFDAKTGQGPSSPECTDGHVTKTRQTSGGTVAHYHVTTEDGINAFDPKEVPLQYTNVMWAAAKSEDFCGFGKIVDVAA